MGIGMTVYAADAALIRRVHQVGTEADPALETDEEPEVLIELLVEVHPFWTSRRTDKSWDVLHWMLTGRLSGERFFGTERAEGWFGEAWTSDLDPAGVERLANELAEVDDATLRARITTIPDAVYSASYRTEPATHEMLIADAKDLVSWMADVAGAGHWLVFEMG